jgi:hypothetical protein
VAGRAAGTLSQYAIKVREPAITAAIVEMHAKHE